ncbi:hypothetical protein TorRG33x02_291580 [Trema orientale]|uniref:COI1 F-box domain-containing protein n=1 Tax=Trema orientale TaxID=63057 RepID=A0A2P5CB45_TREOI|nr:hypothetical protein TorRG33x02_291580 [Trema orientale]
MPYIHDLKDWDAVSLVCCPWYKLDTLTPKHVAIVLYYTTTPDWLQSHFGYLEGLRRLHDAIGYCDFLVVSVLKVLALSMHDHQGFGPRALSSLSRA